MSTLPSDELEKGLRIPDLKNEKVEDMEFFLQSQGLSGSMPNIASEAGL